MITCNIKRKKGNISSVRITGHSEYEDVGKDIVCAAVSALSIAAVNGLTTFVKIEVKYQIKDDGFLEFEMPEIIAQEKILQSNAIVETLYLGLKSIELEYSKYIRVEGWMEVYTHDYNELATICP